MNPRFAQLQSYVREIGGFLIDINIAVWDALLEHQETQYVSGHLCEIGVYKGKSAAILAQHQRPGEQLWLVDFSDFLDEARMNLGPLTRGVLDASEMPPTFGVPAGRVQAKDVHYMKQKSLELSRSPELIRHRRSFRWIHIDGEHTGQAVASDLAIAHELLADDGIICIDDFFNPAYPQISSAVFFFLQAKRFDLTLFLCGYNKGYLARPTYARHYMQMIRSSLGAGLRERGFTEFTLFKTSPSDDFNCWGIDHRHSDRDYYGLDSNPDELC